MSPSLLAWSLSLGALGLALAGIDPLGGGPTARADLVLLLWLAVGALPRRCGPCDGPRHGRGDARRSVPRDLAVPFALLAAPLGLAAGLDARRDPLDWFTQWGGHLALAVVLWGLLLALTRAGEPVARRVAAFGWFALVPGWAALELATGFAAATSGRAASAPRALSPLGWCAVGGGAADALPALLALGLLGLAVLGLERRKGGAR